MLDEVLDLVDLVAVDWRVLSLAADLELAVLLDAARAAGLAVEPPSS